MKETLIQQYNETTALLNETRANIKLLMDKELELQARLNALEDLVRGDNQAQEQAKRDKAREEKNRENENERSVKCPLGYA